MKHKRTPLVFMFVLALALLSSVSPALADVATITMFEEPALGGNIWMDIPGMYGVPVTWNSYAMGYPNGTYDLIVGTNHTFSAVPNAGYEFINFTATDGNTTQSISENPINFAIITSFNITAYFEFVGGSLGNYTIATSANGAVFMDYGVSNVGYPPGAGYAAGQYLLPLGATHSFTAAPYSGYQFTSFSITHGNVSTTVYQNPLVMVVSQNITVTGNFASLTTPTATPTATASPGFSIGTFNTDGTAIVELLIGVVVSFMGLLILIRAPGAWIAGVIMIVAGFFLHEISQPNMVGIIAWSLEIVCFSVFIFQANPGRSNRK